MIFRKWVKESEKEIKPLMNKEIKKAGGLIPEGKEEKLLQSYLTYRIVRVTWILVIATILVGIIGTILNLWF